MKFFGNSSMLLEHDCNRATRRLYLNCSIISSGTILASMASHQI